MTESLEARVARIADGILADQHFVTPVDVLVGLGWLDQSKVDVWRMGLVTSLDRCLRTEATDVLGVLTTWAHRVGLSTWETDYGDLAFTADSDPAVERAFRLRWAAAEEPLQKSPPKRSAHPRVLAIEHAWECNTCGETPNLVLKDKPGGVCLHCAGLGHLVFLPSGDAALTRRTTKTAPVSAVVVRWNARGMRYDRHGVLADQRSIELAAAQCLEDLDLSQSRAIIGEEWRSEILAQFRGCPPARADAIACCATVHGRGRSRGTDPRSIRLAVETSARRIDTDYDDLVLSGMSRDDAIHRTQPRVDDILTAWATGIVLLDA